MGVQLLHIEFPLFTSSAPDDRSPLCVNLHHVLLSPFARPAKDTAKHHRHIAHEIYRVIMHNNEPGEIKGFLPLSLGRFEEIRATHDS